MSIFRALPSAAGRLRACAALLGAGALALACGAGSDGAEDDSESRVVTVEFATVRTEQLRDVATFSGELRAENSVMVKAETEGVVAEVLFEEGQTIEAGAVLFRLRNEEQTARLAEAEANLALAREVDARTRELVTRSAASIAQKDRAAAELGGARARVDLARLELDRTEIRAPFDGVLGQRFVDPGERIDEEVPLVRIDDIDRLQVAFTTADTGILFAKEGARVEIRVAPYPDEGFPGEVFFVSPSLDPGTRRVVVKAWVPNEHRRLRAGLFADVDLEVGRRDDAILVPESAIVFDREGSYVWRVGPENEVTRVPVEVGLRKHGRVEVTLGLNAGDRVVTAGTHKVSEGTRVAAAPEESSMGQARREPPAGEASGEGT